VEKCGRAMQATDHNTTRRMCFVCLITKATDTLRISSTYCCSSATMVTRTRLLRNSTLLVLFNVKGSDAGSNHLTLMAGINGTVFAFANFVYCSDICFAVYARIVSDQC
jgi:hypothetical protein